MIQVIENPVETTFEEAVNKYKGYYIGIQTVDDDETCTYRVKVLIYSDSIPDEEFVKAWDRLDVDSIMRALKGMCIEMNYLDDAFRNIVFRVRDNDSFVRNLKFDDNRKEKKLILTTSNINRMHRNAVLHHSYSLLSSIIQFNYLIFW